MPYFDTRDIAAIAICASLWGVLNSIFSPIFFRMFGVPFLCDLIGFSVLTLTVWWIGKLGSATAVGLIATIINFILSPSSTQFVGFTAASIVFDVATKVVGYDRAFGKAVNTMVSAVSISTLSAAVAGFIIGTFFMAAPALVRWGGVLGWAALHAAGGILGGVIGAVLDSALITRGVLARAKNVDGQKIMVDAVKRSS
jgi:riboflavin transporter FmnP